MAKFKVHMQQYIERVATVEVEADNEADARDLAKHRADAATWTDGDDAYSVEVYAVADEAGAMVWER